MVGMSEVADYIGFAGFFDQEINGVQIAVDEMDFGVVCIDDVSRNLQSIGVQVDLWRPERLYRYSVLAQLSHIRGVQSQWRAVHRRRY